MSIEVLLAIAFVAVLVAIQLVSTAIAIVRCRPGARPAAVNGPKPGISLVRPLCGLEPFSADTLEASFNIDWPEYEVLFCVADADDPIISMTQAAMVRHPHVPARLLIGAERLGTNPKLNNMASGWRAARYDIILFTDSNLLAGTDYLHRLMASWREGAGMVTAPAFGDRPQGFWADVECAMLNAYQVRIQYAVDTLGSGFAQGKSLMFRRRDLERGGFEALASEPAEDAAATKMMRARNASLSVAGPPYPQLLGHKTFKQVWNRHLRWARLRRASFPALYAPEIFSGVLPPLAALLFVAAEFGWSPLLAGLGLLGVWYAPEFLLARIAGWPLTWTSLPAALLRDAMLPALYCSAFSGSSVSWNGNRVSLNAMPKKRKLVLTPRLRLQLLSAVVLAGSLRMPRVASHLQRLADRL